MKTLVPHDIVSGPTDSSATVSDPGGSTALSRRDLFRRIRTGRLAGRSSGSVSASATSGGAASGAAAAVAILTGASVAPAPARAAVAGSDDPLFMSATRLAAAIRAKKFSAVEVVTRHIERIQKVDPMLNAVVMPCYERALAEAKAADAALARGEARGPLHGVPMTIKDSIETEGVISTGGTQGRSNYVPPRDATVVARLRAAGAILLGKTNTPEFTIGGVSGLGTTANILYGMTRNPYDTRYTVYGSSGGAGAIVAAGGSAFDIGSDFGGSIRGPSHACGIAGIKPTSGRVPRTGHIVDYGGTFDNYQQLGPMTRYVEDLVTLTPLISGPDYLDAAIHAVPFGDPAAVKLAGLRVAFYTQQGPGAVGSAGEVVSVIQAAAKALEAAGCAVTEDLPPRIMEANEIRRKLTTGDGNAWQKRLTQRYNTIVPGPARKFDQPQLPVAEFIALLETQDAIKSEILAFMENYDVLICPVRATPLPMIGDPDKVGDLPGSSFTSIYNVTGYPAGVVRGGSCGNKLPIGVQVVGRPWMEHVVFAAMAHLEKTLGGYQPVPI
jgi:amidase